MVSTEQLRLLSALSDRDVSEFSPSYVEDVGENRYTEAERILDDGDGRAYETLEELADLGVLTREFQYKEYVCPSCTAPKLRFTTRCGSCGSLHTLETDVDFHLGCGHPDEEAAFRTDAAADEWSCPECGAIVDPAEDLDRRLLHVCQECMAMTETPDHALRCLECERVCAPSEADERALYRYRLEADGEAWLETQLDAREALAAALADRGFDVSVDTTVGADGETYAVDLVATDELLGERVVGAVHERPDADAVETLVAATEAARARSVLVTTSGALDPNVAAIVDREEIRVLSPDGERLVSSYDVVGEDEASTVFQRLTSSVTERLRSSTPE